ncbi:MAG TPA: heavy metal-responsive transcriptional regulator [Gemmatimonadaceae bacterium]|nr:heavy metal-responsive transcriptional regulator [Gemmatimonadaceae bacterium]
MTFKIGELARRSGAAPDTLRYYERVGLLAPSGRTEAGYRRYDEAALERLAFIRRAQALGLTLAEVRDIIAIADEGRSPCEHVQAALTRHLDEVDARIAELRLLRQSIAELLAAAPEPRAGKACVCGMIEASESPNRQAAAARKRERPRSRQAPISKHRSAS